MSLQYKFFVIPLRDIEKTEAEINRFLRTVRVINAQREFVPQGDNSFWTIAIEYQTGTSPKSPGKKREKIDYQSVLSQEDFVLYLKLREWRKKTADEEGIPVYVVLTNEQMAKIAERKIFMPDGVCNPARNVSMITGSPPPGNKSPG